MEILVWLRAPGEPADKLSGAPIRLTTSGDFRVGTDEGCLVRLTDERAALHHARIDVPGPWAYTTRIVVVPMADMHIDGVPTTWPTEITADNTLAIGGTELRLEVVRPAPRRSLSKWDPRSWFAGRPPIGRTVNPPPPRYRPMPPPPSTGPGTRLPTSDPDEANLLASLASEPRAEATRMVYADWLEERGLSEHARFVRAPVPSIDDPLGQLVAATTTGAWRATVCAAPVVECERSPCAGVWPELAPTSEPIIRRCGACEHDVRYGHDHATIHAAGLAHAPYARDYAVDAALARQWYGELCRPCGFTNPAGTVLCLNCGAALA